MLQYTCGVVSATTTTALNALQAKVDSEQGREAQYKEASRLFASKKGPVWRDVKAVLSAVSPPGRSCFYCERDRYRDIDHRKPKRHYPGLAFNWDNYIYACAICNQDAKKDKYGIWTADGKVVVFDRGLDWLEDVPDGTDLLIDIRSENPFNFLSLDLETGVFLPLGNGLDRERALFTRDLFDLNESSLVKIRMQSYKFFRSYLEEFWRAFSIGDKASQDRVISEMADLQHPTVLAEIRRQKGQLGLDHIFDQLPGEVGAAIRTHN